jgi:PDZ domain-containing secreted protein
VKAAYLGVSVACADATLQSQLKLPEGVGLKVVSVMADGPAAAAGLKEHDVIHKLDDQIVINPSQFEVLIRMHKPGETVNLTIIRQSQERVIKAALVEHDMPELSWILMDPNRASTTSQATSVAGAVTQFTSGGGTLTIGGSTTPTAPTK